MIDSKPKRPCSRELFSPFGLLLLSEGAFGHTFPANSTPVSVPRCPFCHVGCANGLRFVIRARIFSNKARGTATSAS